MSTDQEGESDAEAAVQIRMRSLLAHEEAGTRHQVMEIVETIFPLISDDAIADRLCDEKEQSNLLDFSHNRSLIDDLKRAHGEKLSMLSGEERIAYKEGAVDAVSFSREVSRSGEMDSMESLANLASHDVEAIILAAIGRGELEERTGELVLRVLFGPG